MRLGYLTRDCLALRAPLAIVFCVSPGIVLAYVGPGPGITFLGALLALIVAVLVALGGVILWPLRSYWRKRKNAKTGAESETASEGCRGDQPMPGDTGSGE